MAEKVRLCRAENGIENCKYHRPQSQEEFGRVAKG
jgi:hypothetical protein